MTPLPFTGYLGTCMLSFIIIFIVIIIIIIIFIFIFIFIPPGIACTVHMHLLLHIHVCMPACPSFGLHPPFAWTIPPSLSGVTQAVN